MEIEIVERKVVDAKFLKVSAGVRHWEDAEINGDNAESSSDVPFAKGDLWEPVIDIDSGAVIDWPEGVSAKFHFKVCDAGSYYLLDKENNALASIINDYVPNGLCHGDTGYGDYIIFNVDAGGKIINYKQNIAPADWFDED